MSFALVLYNLLKDFLKYNSSINKAYRTFKDSVKAHINGNVMPHNKQCFWVLQTSKFSKYIFGIKL